MAGRKNSRKEPCPVARGVDLVGERWALLIVRDAFDGVRRFGEFQRSLGVARNILADRLRLLVEAGILASQPASDGSAYQEYVLTAKGEDLFPVIVALRRWGERHLFAPGEPHSVLVLRDTGGVLTGEVLGDERHGAQALALRTADGRELSAADVYVKKVPADPDRQ
ncbi:winged helix-turn-helix transcriptional regulator [Pseudoduganella umbonata]|uniref:DNA-binding HxlR family transcriptional regulator n=1 Tax=Pseudoduganella umbonata TaxID=864828 RepID=A0A4P8I0M1_9BURK|nr:helix-turn-helix domain-containing protein [Pseudoduganella umbonata]MBB3221800.1 DNA-binding HxlR family transcriptional regulator [Pseudoduganella umbonata]QCP14390.1 helix-turn-helix transcriptional regulator [Pseudoduganella umbonata]